MRLGTLPVVTDGTTHSWPTDDDIEADLLGRASVRTGGLRDLPGLRTREHAGR